MTRHWVQQGRGCWLLDDGTPETPAVIGRQRDWRWRVFVHDRDLGAVKGMDAAMLRAGVELAHERDVG